MQFFEKYNKQIKIGIIVFIILAIIVSAFTCGKKKSNEKKNSAGNLGEIKDLNIENDTAKENETIEQTKGEIIEETIEQTKEDEPITTIQKEENSSDSLGESIKDEKSEKNTSLKVSGNKLVDKNGNKVQLRGVSTHGIAWYPQYINQQFFTELKNTWNANVIRLAMYTAESGGYCSGGNKEQLKQLVKDGVKFATNANMYVIIDWHILQDANPLTNKTEAKQFFDEMSKEFRDFNNVIYEICNEPNSGTSWQDIKAYANEIIPVIRANDSDAIIIVGTPTWSQEVDKVVSDPITGYDNIMYALHFYAATHTDSLRDRMVKAVNAGIPIFVTEFGTCDASGNGGIDINQSNAWIKTMNEYDISYVAWNLSNKNETSAIFKENCNKVASFATEDLSENGKWIYEMLTGKSSLHNNAQTIGQENSQQNSQQNAQTNLQTNSQTNNTTNSALSNAQGSTSNTGNVKYTETLSNSWESGGKTFYQYTLIVENISGKDIDSWSVSVNFNESISFSDGWNADYTVNDKTLNIASKDYNGKLVAGEKTGDVGFIVSGGSDLKIVK
ncbi:MAG: cellulase family glycosylhydrolase [Lachnospiraceae bacterium]|nr:cellulase family glycosylhydrolase [Lachnospiraceae bacterium]